jgi:hypothetical protein
MSDADDTSMVKRAGKDWYNIHPGDLIVCVRTRDTLFHFPELIGKVGIFIKRGLKTSKRVESDLALIDGEVRPIEVINWERVADDE